jgi:hypothetical protein
LNLLNEIRPINWQGIAMATDQTKQTIVFGKWKVHGNVHFKKDIIGSEFLNDIDVATISTDLKEKYPQIDSIIEKAYVRKIFSENIHIILFSFKIVSFFKQFLS